MESVIDTSVLVDYILIDSEFHERAKAGLEKIERGFLPTVVAEELVHALDRLKLDKRLISEKLREVLDTYNILGISADNLADAERLVMTESNTTFKRFNDKLILSVVKERKMQLFTFDQDLIKECKANGVKLLLA